MPHFELVWWWMLFLLPLPLLVYFLAPPVKERSAVYLPYLPDSAADHVPAHLLPKILATLIWVALVTAAARPVWYGDPIQNQPKHRDMMLVVDLSGSMEQKDMLSEDDQYIDRLSTVKLVLHDFVQKRKGDRLGLVLFADHAYLQTPLTLDINTITTQIRQMVLGLVGRNTAIGEGIGLATKTFVDSDAPQRVMILLTDGMNTAGVLKPVEAAEIAQKYHTTIYTIGVGAGEMIVRDFLFRRKVDTAKDLDEETLQKIATMTGGRYFRARNKLELQNIYDTINQLEPVSRAKQLWRPQTEWFYVPLTLALIFSSILVFLRRHD
ncbi:IMP dehydrogenase [Vibrio albus]|uniref:IMP dehydrogenase n=1 Tax=Vibrio albus TaxID=2200953 RepID=A0A2U3B7E9_9VIBR|nr:VWA domain-containing protein [Vibrio albus]PWI32711.1 IMP dehydrogenase [Vibrio albus]